MIPGAVTVGYLHPGRYAACFAESLFDMFLHDITGPGRMLHAHGKMAKECAANGIVSGRNELARLTIAGEAEWLFMVDSDMGFAADTVERLIEAADPVERPVVGGLCFANKVSEKKDFFGMAFECQPTVYHFVDLPDKVGFAPMFDYPRDQMVPCAATGGACVLIHRTVLEAILAKYGARWFDCIEHAKGPTVFSEDLSFAIRVAGCDFPMFVHTGVKTTHDKGAAFIDEPFFDAQEAMRTYQKSLDKESGVAA